MMGLGIFPTDHPLYMGMLGMHGVKTANEAVSKCDTMILIGARVGDRAVRSPKFLAKTTKIIHIDVDPAEIGKNIHVDIPLVGDCGNILEQLCAHVECSERADWLAELAQIKNEIPTENETQGYVNPKMFIRKLSAKLPENTICVADVGQNQIWSCAYAQVKNGTFMTSGGMGTMGYSIPAAMGAKVGCPKRQVVAVCGDGSFQMSMMELATMRQHDIPVKIIVLKNNYLGMVRQYQHFTYKDNYSVVDLSGSPDLEHIAKAYDMKFIRIENMDDYKAGIKKFLKNDEAYLMECLIDPMDLV